MKTSLLHKEGIDLLVEEVMTTNSLDDGLDAAREAVLPHIPDSDKNKNEIIELRNDNTIQFLEDEGKAVTRIMEKLSRYSFAKEIYFKDAMTEVFKINLVLNKKYALNDIFVNAKMSKEEDCSRIDVHFESMNLAIVQEYRDTVAKYVSYCHDCLFEDLYDNATLVKYLPIVYFLLAVDLC